jgi:GTP-binding protein
LGHIERCAILLHLIDGTSENVVGDCETILTELEAYSDALYDKPRVTVLNKIDALSDEEIAEKREALQKAIGGKVMLMSGVAKTGVTEVLRVLRAGIDDSNLRQKKLDAKEDEAWRP